MTDTYELPELPEPDMSHQKAVDDYDEETSYSAEALQEYARLAVKVERERCAKVCEQIRAVSAVSYELGTACAAAIRKG